MGKFDEFVYWAFCGALSGCAVYGVSVLSKLNASIETLNGQIAKLLEQARWHEETIKSNRERISALEIRVSRVEDRDR